MKTIKRKVLVVVFMLGTLFNYANDKKDFNNAIDTKKVKVVFKNVKKGHTLTIKNQYGDVLHTENISKEGNLTKFFNLSSLKNGNYSIELNKDFRIIIRPFLVKDNLLFFQKDLESVIFKPVIRNQENLVLISKNAFDNKPVKIILYYNDYTIYKETVTNETFIKRVYKLDNKEKGNYRVVVLNNGRSYTKEFKL